MLQGVNHIGIAVKDLNQATQAYRAQGIQAGPVHRLPDMEAAMVSVGNTQLELMAPTSPEGPVGKFIESRGEGIHHICIEVDNIDKEIDTLTAKGIRMVDKVARQGLEGRIAFIHPKSMNGVLIELVEKKE